MYKRTSEKSVGYTMQCNNYFLPYKNCSHKVNGRKRKRNPNVLNRKYVPNQKYFDTKR